MNEIQKLKALGLMSGTALTGVDVALVETDGLDIYDISFNETIPYDEGLKDKLSSIIGLNPDNEKDLPAIKEVDIELTKFHADIVNEYIKDREVAVDVIGFHGHTILQDPEQRISYQSGDGSLMHELTKIPVVNKFHRADIFAGGQGAPIYPVYHEALCAKIEKPVAVLNMGGKSSITLLGRNGEMMAFDIGPGNAAINSWTLRKGGQEMDFNGKLAATGIVNEKIVASLMRHKYFAKYPPKSLDVSIFNEKLEHLSGSNLEDGAATVTAFVAEAVSYSISLYLPEQPKQLILCGGGAKNPTLRRFIRQRLDGIEVISGEDYGWGVTSIEAQAVAYLAVRRLYNMPSTFPTTTGAAAPVIIGELHK